MGVTNAFEKANQLVAKELDFTIGGEATEFRQLLWRIGWARFEHCVGLTKLDSRKGAKGAQKYARLTDLMRHFARRVPAGKYRSPESERGRQLNMELDREMHERIAAEP